TAQTWVTELASNYGVTGKVWDCPTTSFTGTEAAPDYFFVGGSLLSATALGDIKDPVAAPLTADLASPQDSKPYLEEPANAQYVDLGLVTLLTDTRHNHGAVFSYVDGHLAWLAKEQITAGTFFPSIATTEKKLVLGGMIVQPVLAKSISQENGTALMAKLAPLNLTLGFGGNDAGTYGGRTFNATTYEYTGDRMYWPVWLDKAGTVPRPSELTGTGGTLMAPGIWPLNATVGTDAVTFTLLPAATAPTGTKRVAFAFSGQRYDAGTSYSASMALTKIQVGSATPISITSATAKIDLELPYAAPPAAPDYLYMCYTGVNVLLLPVKPGVPIKLTFTITNAGTSWLGNMLFFEA
ncbi:MAG: hypothetical protein ACYC7E_04890, partial [Armatimonadota bacterium]